MATHNILKMVITAGSTLLDMKNTEKQHASDTCIPAIITYTTLVLQ